MPPSRIATRIAETLTCLEGHEWTREKTRGPKPLYCPEHKAIASPRASVAPPKPKERTYERLQQGKQSKSLRERESKIETIITHSRADACQCGITPQITDDELRALGGGCTEPQWVCPVLVSVRQAVTVKPKAKKEEDE